MIPITDLEVFVRVVSAGNMSAAGRELGLSPAVISKRIGHLEKRLGARLFQRTTRQIHLTETGHGFFERVVGILSGIDEAEAFVARRNNEPGGTLRLVAPSRFASAHLTPHLPQFLNQYPDLKIDVTVSDEWVDIVGTGMDVAIRIGELEDSSLVARKLAPCPRVLCAAPSYLKEAGEPKEPADLEKHNCLTTIDRRSWQLDGPNGIETVRISGNLSTKSSAVTRSAVLAGLGIGFRAWWDVGEDIEAGRLRAIMPDYHETQGVAVYAVYACRQYVPAKIRVFVDFLAELYGEQFALARTMVRSPRKRRTAAPIADGMRS